MDNAARNTVNCIINRPRHLPDREAGPDVQAFRATLDREQLSIRLSVRSICPSGV
jgi:hypothetical protein